MVSYKGKSPNNIVEFQYYFSSDWHFFQALSWLDYFNNFKNKFNILKYIAIETRIGIEILWFEILVTSLGTKLDIKTYKKCTTQAQRMYKLIDKLVPEYKKLLQFTKFLLSFESNSPNIIEWDINKLKKFHGQSSQFLHFTGQPKDTFENENWLNNSASNLIKILEYIKLNMSKGDTGILLPETFQPKIVPLWNDFKRGKISITILRNKIKKIYPDLQSRSKNP